MTAILINLTTLAISFMEDHEKAKAKAEADDLFIITSADDLLNLSGTQMVDVYNKTVALLNSMEKLGLQPTNRFGNKETGQKRLMANLNDLYAVSVKDAKKPEKKNKPVEKDTHRKSRGVNLSPKSKIYPCRAGTKQARLVDMLSKASGATFRELHEAMNSAEFAHLKPWLEITTRSALNWDMNKVKGYGIKTTLRPDGEQAYHLTYPSGITAPVPHTPRKS